MLTKGWDTISIIKVDAINEDMKTVWKEDKALFSMELPDEAGHMEGNFSCFRIISGGGGKILRMELPIQKGILTLGEEKLCLDGMSAVIEVTLSLMPTNESMLQLKTEYHAVAGSREEMTDDKSGWILPIMLIDPSGVAGILGQAILDAVCNFLIENPSQVEQVFAEINFAKIAAPDWARLRKCKYSYLDSGYLAVLGVCDDRDISTLPLDIDVTGISLGVNSFYVMSGKLVLKNLILPSLLEIYENGQAGCFLCSDNEIHNIQKLYMHEIKSGAIYYQPEVREGGNTARVESDSIRICFYGDCDMYVGINMSWYGSLVLKAQLKGGYVDLAKVTDDFTHDEDIPWYLAWLIPIVGLIVQLVVAIIADDLSESIEQRSCSIEAEGVDTVRWCNRQEVVQSAYLSESLIIEYQ